MTTPRRLGPIFALGPEDRRFLEECRELDVWPESFLACTRAMRLGISASDFARLGLIERCRELADERAILPMPDTEYLRAFQPQWGHIDCLVKIRATNEEHIRSQAWQFAEAEIAAL